MSAGRAAGVRSPWKSGWLALAVGAVGYLLLAARDQFLTGDPTYYVGLARSIVAGEGYRILGQPHSHFPPGLPLLLAPIAAVTRDVAVFQWLVALFAPTSLWLAHRWIRGRDPSLAPALVVALVANVSFFTLATAGIRSELPYLAVTGTLLLAIDAAERGRPPLGPGFVPAIGLLAAFLVALRVVGVVLALAMVVSWFHRRRRGTPLSGLDRGLLAGGVVGMAMMAGWVGWGAWTGSPSYLDRVTLVDPHYPDLGDGGVLQILINAPRALVRRLTGVVELGFNIQWLAPAWGSPAIVATGAVLGAGIVKELRAPNPLLGWYLLGYGAVLVAWPFDEGVRFLLPVFPMLFLVAWRGAFAIYTGARSLPARTVTFALRGVAVGCLALLVIETLTSEEASSQRLVFAATWAMIGVAAPALAALDLSRTALRRLGFGLVGLSAVIGAVRIAPLATANLTGRHRSPNAELEPGVRWLAANTAPGDVVMAEFASAIEFHTGRPAVALPKTGRPDVLETAIREARVRWLVILDPPEFPYYRPTEVERLVHVQNVLGNRISLAHRFAKGAVYRIE